MDVFYQDGTSSIGGARAKPKAFRSRCRTFLPGGVNCSYAGALSLAFWADIPGELKAP